MSRALVLAERRKFPLLATLVLVVITMAVTTWWGPAMANISGWQLPDDLWGTMLAAHRLLHLHPSGLYSNGTGLVSFPGAALALVPLAALIDLSGASLAAPGPHNLHPSAWLLAGPYEIILSASVLFAADAIAERMGCSQGKRFALATAEAVALWNVASDWGHPEDALAVALLLYSALALCDESWKKAAWLFGAALSVQPLVLLALPLLLVATQRSRLGPFLLRAAAPSAVMLGVAFASNAGATLRAVTDQPNWPRIDHPTPWTSLSPRLPHGAVAAGPGRALAVFCALGLAAIAERVWHRTGSPMRSAYIGDLIWWIAAALALRCVFESVMVAYYVWPVLAVAMIAAAPSWRSLLLTAAFSSALTFTTQLNWRGAWSWWSMVVVGAILALATARFGVDATAARRRALVGGFDALDTGVSGAVAAASGQLAP